MVAAKVIPIVNLSWFFFVLLLGSFVASVKQCGCAVIFLGGCRTAGRVAAVYDSICSISRLPGVALSWYLRIIGTDFKRLHLKTLERQEKSSFSRNAFLLAVE